MITKTAIKLQPWARALTLSTHHSKELPEINVSQSSMLQKQVTQYANLEKTKKPLQVLIKEAQNRDKNKLVRSCQYIHHEFLVRLAKVVSHLQNLPFILLCNEDIKRVHDLYMYAFENMLRQQKIQSLGDVDNFNETLSGLLDDLQDIIWLLSKGFHASQHHVTSDVVRRFMDYIIIHRLCNRILARHHLSMHVNREGYISIVNMELDLKKMLQRNATFAANICQNIYMDTLPEVKIEGHVETKVAFIPNIIDYILKETMKNSFRATMESHVNVLEKPPIVCTICNSENFWHIRISDKGKGMSDNILQRINNYCFTTYSRSEESEYSNAFGEILSTAKVDRGSSLAGFGVGIPVSKAYMNFVHGGMKIMSMNGIGSDVYIKIPHIDGLLTKLHI